jgi:hypothetical protein
MMVETRTRVMVYMILNSSRYLQVKYRTLRFLKDFMLSGQTDEHPLATNMRFVAT